MVKVSSQPDRSARGLFVAYRALYHRQLAAKGEEPRSKGLHVPVTKILTPTGAGVTFSMVAHVFFQVVGVQLDQAGQQVMRPADTRGRAVVPAKPLRRVTAHHDCFTLWLRAAEQAGQLASHPARYGVQIYLAGEAPERADSTAFAGSLDALGL